MDKARRVFHNAVHHNRKGLAKVRRVKRDSLGFITALRDERTWMFHQMVYDKHGNLQKVKTLDDIRQEIADAEDLRANQGFTKEEKVIASLEDKELAEVYWKRVKERGTVEVRGEVVGREKEEEGEAGKEIVRYW